MKLPRVVSDKIDDHHVRMILVSGFLRQKSYRIQGFSRPFHSIIQGQFNAILPVDHSIAYSPTDTQEKRRTDLKH